MYYYGVDEFNEAMERRQQDTKAESQAKAAFISGKAPVKARKKVRKKPKKKQGFISKLLTILLK